MVIRRCSTSADLTAHKLDANPWADAIQIQHRHQRGHAEQQVIEKPSVNMYLPASLAQSRESVPLNKGRSVENPALCTVLYVSEATAQLYGAGTNMEDTGTHRQQVCLRNDKIKFNSFFSSVNVHWLRISFDVPYHIEPLIQNVQSMAQCKQRKGFSLHSTGINLLSQRLSTVKSPESRLSCRPSLTTVGRQSKQCDGKYSGPLHSSHNTCTHESAPARLACSGRAMGSVRLSPGAALCQSSVFHCWPSPDSREMLSWEEPRCTRTKDAFNTSTHQLYSMCPVKATVRMCCISTHQAACGLNKQHYCLVLKTNMGSRKNMLVYFCNVLNGSTGKLFWSLQMFFISS